jgi:predicted nucleic acid-binding protein
MKLIGIDTSVVVGLLDSKDLWHKQAVELQEAISSNHWQPIYFDCVLAESISIISRRLHEKHRTAELPHLIARIKHSYPADTISWILPETPRLYEQVLQLMESFAGELNFNDSLIALLCQEQTIPLLASFDKDFDKVPWLKRVATAADVYDVAS